ncbi:hypothetical protein C7401_11068 [Paraburkholderia unamae]|uniref:hypothetical protein n=1 Tax=Paraburkholderia unamae TaxID=219649 RepID=UPI000DC550B2|nr:hypothetical protein [Paraburkholderia unamae]RAR59939.1 hypothetical protein C7401_11068 [Paraburkholderia unamae]
MTADFMRKQSSLIKSTVVSAFLMIACAHVSARSITVNDVTVNNENPIELTCVIFLRHAMGNSPAGDDSYACDKFRSAKDDDIVDTIPASAGHPAVSVRKKDYISLDDLSPWNGVVPVRAFFGITSKHESSDPDVTPSYLPYDRQNEVYVYWLVDRDGYEVNVLNGKRTGYRFYDFRGICYLATEKKPRKYRYLTKCEAPGYEGFPKSVDVTSHPWVNIMEQNTVDLGEGMPASMVEIRGSMPVKPLIYSDYPIGDNGRVTKGRAMCMADCAPGMLMKLLHAGQSIWGQSGKPPAK